MRYNLHVLNAQPLNVQLNDSLHMYIPMRPSHTSKYRIFLSFHKVPLYPFSYIFKVSICFPGSSAGKESACKEGDPSSILGSRRLPGEGIGYPLQYSWASLVAQLVKNLPAMWDTWVRSLDWEGKGYPLQYSGLENSMDCIVHRVTKSQIQLNDFHFHFHSKEDPKYLELEFLKN